MLVAPVQLRTRLRELIMREAEHAKAGRPARMIIKINAVTDDQMIRVLYRASQAGVLDRPDRPRHLQPAPGHSRASATTSACARSSAASSSTRASTGSRTAASEEMYIGSADLMERNLDRRVETLTPVRDTEILAAHPRRRACTRTCATPTARWCSIQQATTRSRFSTGEPFDSQRFLLQHYTESRND